MSKTYALTPRTTLEAHRTSERFFRCDDDKKTFVVKVEDGKRVFLSCKPTKKSLIESNKTKLEAFKKEKIEEAIKAYGVPEDATEIWLQEHYKNKTDVRICVMFYRTGSVWHAADKHPLAIEHADLHKFELHNFIILDPTLGQIYYYGTGLNKEQRKASVSHYAVVGVGVYNKTVAYNVTSIMARPDQKFKFEDSAHELYRHYAQQLCLMGSPQDELDEINELWLEDKEECIKTDGKKHMWEQKVSKRVFLLAFNDGAYRRKELPAFLHVAAVVPCEKSLYALYEQLSGREVWSTERPLYTSVAEGDIDQVRWFKPDQCRIITLNRPIPTSTSLVWIDVTAVTNKGGDLEHLVNPAFLAGSNESKILNIPSEELRDRVLHHHVFKEMAKRKRDGCSTMTLQSRFSEVHDEDSMEAPFKKLKQ